MSRCVPEFLPLKNYRKAISIALLVPMLLAVVLCFHLYQIKLERQYQVYQAQFYVLAGQVEQETLAAQTVITSIRHSLAEPIRYQLDENWQQNIRQQSGYFYRQLPDNGGEVVGLGRFVPTAALVEQWQQIMALGPSFDTALALIDELEAVVFIQDNGFAFVKRRDTSQSNLLTAIVESRFTPQFSQGITATSMPTRVFGKHYFALGQRLTSGSLAQILLIYDVDKLAGRLQQMTFGGGELALKGTQPGVTLATSKGFREPEANPSHNDKLPWEGGVRFSYQPPAQPFTLRFVQSEASFSAPARYEALLELGFLILFIVSTFAAYVWLNAQVFIRPLKHFVKYLTYQENTPETTMNYAVPRDWQPWFIEIKRVVTQKRNALQQLQENNLRLDEQVQQQKKALSRSLEAKERQAALLKTVLNSVPDLVYYKNIDGSFIGCNEAFERFIGVEQVDLVAHEHHEVTERHLALLDLELAMNRQEQSLTDTLLLEGRSYLITVSPLYNDLRKRIGTLGVARDISEQQQALTALRASEQNFKAAIEYAPNGVILLSIDRLVLELNRTARKLFDRVDIGSSLYSVFEDADVEALNDVLDHCLHERQGASELSLAQQDPKRWLHLSVSLVWDKQKNPKYFVIHVQNVTALIRARLDAERANHAKSRFIANISHEIRTPINAILGLVSILKPALDERKEQHKLEQIESAAQQLLAMLNDILNFARLESGQGKSNNQPFCIVDLIANLSSLITPLSSAKQLEFEIEVEPFIWPRLIGDEARIKLVLMNLLGNAVKFTEHGRVGLTLSLQQDNHGPEQAIRFCVWDTGPGISEEDQARLFDAFTQGNESSSRPHEGIGLGLAIVKQVIQLLGGEVTLSSKPQVGSRFEFTLRLERAALAEDDSRKSLFLILEQQGPLPYLAHQGIRQGSETELNTLNTTSSVSYLACDNAERVRRLSQTEFGRKIHWLVPDTDSFTDALPAESDAIRLSAPVFYQSLSVCSLERSVTDSPGTHTLTPLLCIVVDDNPVNLDISRTVLEQRGATVIALSNAENIVTICQKLRPDVVLMDLYMPNIDGYEASRQLRRQFDGQALPIVALTANAHEQEKQQALATGLNGFLVKPITPADLCLALLEYVPAGEVVFDYSFALTQMMNKEALLRTMLEKFAKLCEEYMTSLQGVESATELASLAHTIKGSAAGLGLRRLAEQARQCEAQSKQTDELASDQLSDQLYMAVEQTLCFISLWLKG
ncbi:ATP-binding protein [Pseudoalteromonas sp. R3]|uniref:PAS domain-containing hybrid sensor histidine kinase/response regulator n=1 Tax=Pseudoalteromonas sp. R3 TaxID=1709477 RepID=UPI0006B65B06|nr:ATP-binding protein [Pseudoalteromonas sp. R3]AZZ97420.1 response regulator [Pseudoalteromonas sp. R3]